MLPHYTGIALTFVGYAALLLRRGVNLPERRAVDIAQKRERVSVE